MDDDLVFKDTENSHNILIVEDETPDQVLLKKRLEEIWPNSKTLAVKSLQEAYDVYKKNNFDLVLLDLNLPDGYGPSTVQEVRKFNKSVPVIVITGLGTNLTVDETLKLGANNVVLKSQIMNEDFANILQQNVED